MKKRLPVLWLFLLIACHSVTQSVTVAAAADLRFAMDELTAEFKKANPGISMNVIYGSTGNLFQQIIHQAPFDLFFAADMSFPEKLDSLGLTAGKPLKYAIGHLVLWSSSMDVSEGPEILRDKKIYRISVANPKVAPYGSRAVECLRYYSLYDDVSGRLVMGENVSQAAEFVLTGNAEVGIIALSLALSPQMTKKGNFSAIDTKSHSKLEQAYVILKNSAGRKEVLKFAHFIDSVQAREIFSKYGFKLPGDK